MENYDHRPRIMPEPAARPVMAAAAQSDRHLQRWQRLAGHLTPLVGERGFCALYGKAARVLSPGFPWLSSSQSCVSITALFATLGADLASTDDNTADAANAALYATFTELLSALIGEALTNRLLTSANAHDTGVQQAQEHKL